MNEQASLPFETVWQCQACGKLSHDQYGLIPITHGWDEACSLNAIEIPVSQLWEEAIAKAKGDAGAD